MYFICTLLTAYNARHATPSLFQRASKDESNALPEIFELTVDIFGLYVTSFTRKITKHKKACSGSIVAISCHFQVSVDLASAASLLALALRVLAAAGPDVVTGYLRLRGDNLSALEISDHVMKKMRASSPTGTNCMQLVRKYVGLKNQISGLRTELQIVSRKFPGLDDGEAGLRLQAECIAEVVFWQWVGSWMKTRGLTVDSDICNVPFPTAAKVEMLSRQSLEHKLELLLNKLEQKFVVKSSAGSLFSS